MKRKKINKGIKNKILKAARTPMCSSKVHLDRKKEAKKKGHPSKNNNLD